MKTITFQNKYWKNCFTFEIKKSTEEEIITLEEINIKDLGKYIKLTEFKFICNASSKSITKAVRNASKAFYWNRMNDKCKEVDDTKVERRVDFLY